MTTRNFRCVLTGESCDDSRCKKGHCVPAQETSSLLKVARKKKEKAIQTGYRERAWERARTLWQARFGIAKGERPKRAIAVAKGRYETMMPGHGLLRLLEIGQERDDR